MNSDDNAFLATVMDQLVDAVCVVDVQGRFVFDSAAGESIRGRRHRRRRCTTAC